MRTIRTMLLLSAAALLAAGVAMAAGRAGGARYCPTGGRMARHLELSDSQKTQVRDICAKYRPDFQALRTEKLEPGAKRARARELRAKMRGEISALLTPEQRDKLGELRQDKLRREWTKDPVRGGRHAHIRKMMDRAARELELTPEQREKVRDLFARHRDEVRTLVRDAHAPDADRSRIRERAQTLKEKVVAEVRPILTPDQQQKLQTMIQRWEQKHQG